MSYNPDVLLTFFPSPPTTHTHTQDDMPAKPRCYECFDALIPGIHNLQKDYCSLTCCNKASLIRLYPDLGLSSGSGEMPDPGIPGEV
jgi:hypothetical protein